jgi:hypothetical protein
LTEWEDQEEGEVGGAKDRERANEVNNTKTVLDEMPLDILSVKDKGQTCGFVMRDVVEL